MGQHLLEMSTENNAAFLDYVLDQFIFLIEPGDKIAAPDYMGGKHHSEFRQELAAFILYAGSNLPDI
jgi:hypothetical protein